MPDLNPNVEGWTVAYRTSTDYEADLVRDRLDDAGIPAVVLTKRDHAFNLNVGDMAHVFVMVPPSRLGDAHDVLNAVQFTDAELEEAALAADLDAPPAHDDASESALDSGLDGLGRPGETKE
ncbi:MAG: hypothetical protein AAF624_04565 [Bacteroidota bacterium]